MLDVIFALKFIHVLAASAMLGVWLCLALFMLLAHRSANPPVIAVASQFVVSIEKAVMPIAIAAQPVSGFPLSWAIGLSPFNEFWIVISLAMFAAMTVGWIAAFRVELRIRGMSREAALNSVPLPDRYRVLFHIWSALAVVVLLAMTSALAMMIWQPRLD